MENADFEILLDFIDRKIEQAPPAAADYWLGFCQGVTESLRPTPEAPDWDRSLLREVVGQGAADASREAYARGYLDGCSGRISPGY